MPRAATIFRLLALGLAPLAWLLAGPAQARAGCGDGPHPAPLAAVANWTAERVGAPAESPLPAPCECRGTACHPAPPAPPLPPVSRAVAPPDLLAPTIALAEPAPRAGLTRPGESARPTRAAGTHFRPPRG